MERGGVMMQAAVVVTFLYQPCYSRRSPHLECFLVPARQTPNVDRACTAFHVKEVHLYALQVRLLLCPPLRRRTLCRSTNMHGSQRTMLMLYKVNHRFWVPSYSLQRIKKILSPASSIGGVRGLMLDIYDFLGDLWLCHSTGTCFDFTAFRPLNATLLEIASFLATNPNEVITIFIEDYVTTPNALTNHFIATGLMKYMFPVAKMPKDGSDWPTVASMIASNQRFVVFTSDEKKEISEGIAYQWNYVVENQYGTLAETCANRAESAVLTDKTKSLILENYFPDMPNSTQACVINSANLAKATTVCYAAAGNRWSNFLAVDFYKRSNAGGVFSAVNTLNGQLHCGCNDIRLCLATPGQTSCSVKTQTQSHSQPTVQSAAAGPQSSAFIPSPAPDSSSYHVSVSKFILCLLFLISLISSGIVHA